MITQIISEYLKSHRRLNIPGVGAFMSKGESGEILFSELLKKDDGVLRTLLTESGMREIEVAASVDRFVFELRHATEEVGGEFVMEGFGTLKREDGGKLMFIVGAESLEPEIQEIQEEIQEVSEAQEIQESIQEPIIEPVIEPVQAQSQEPPQPSSQSASEGGEVRYTPEKIKELYYKPQSFRENDPDVEDLTYSKKRKPLNGYTYVKSEKKGGVDKVLLFGIIAAVIAVAVIIYGYYVSHIEQINSLFIE